MAVLDEEILLKDGPELFKEIYRVYPVAEVDDYHKGGLWRDDVMRLDLQLLLSHTREAGAAYPEPLDESKLPKLPPANSAAGMGGLAPMGGVRPLMPVAVPGAANSIAATEMRLLTLFVTKWGLDAAKTKVIMDKLPTPRRRYVFQNFKSEGTDPNGNLEKYIASCEATNIWPAATALAPTMPSPGVASPRATMVTPPPAAQRPGMATMARPMMPGQLAQPRPAVMMQARPGGMGIAMPPRAVLPPSATMAGSAQMKRPLGMVVAAPGYDPSKRPRSVAPKAYGAVPAIVRPGLRPAVMAPGMQRY
mmetsp:Transcript_58246/g.123641  ORF Transcript_58246/g.123641 Transcript_58246/m.123641 type:complete len:306 (-) Transcript_58246:350-1267(-)|eukprot:CAMPEP_0206427992 /NCGR_PEP_ID=MMETSP0324_2-20121206/5382_1 /ASSEMBLY_ACC=CAM_ASM_000836 /TAXON_ID=2866 /ORGANISM="Crypthecodinium cohnii, Strain Seligo" /LENGTH=305 /DNA_ID=CAMNT_0053893401 /DNA_START=100 /DNA_END=1017 /DNA_ORIENTATION=+